MKILFVYKEDRSFVKQDYDILSKHYEVIPFCFKISRIFRLYRLLRECDLVFIWFASYHAFFVSLFTKKPKVVVTGGYDVACEKDIGYGLLCKPLFRYMVRYILRRAVGIIAVSDFNRLEVEKIVENKNIKVIYNSVDNSYFKPCGVKEDIVLTVGFVNDETWVRKGIDFFCMMASFFNDESIKFVVVGKIDDDLKYKVMELEKKVPNLFFIGYVSDDELLSLYQKAKVYCQFSKYESFSVSTVEGMLCGCVPVVTRCGALPEVVGDTGFYVDCSDLDMSKKTIEYALKSNKGYDARVRSIEFYSPDIKEFKLLEMICGVFRGSMVL